MEYCFDDDFGCIINSALRYAISRHTYMPGVVVDFIRRYINIIDTKTIDVTIKDIDQELKQNNVHDPEMWSALKAELEARLSQLQTKNAELSE